MVNITERPSEVELAEENSEEKEMYEIKYLGDINVGGTNIPVYLVYEMNIYRYPKRIESVIIRYPPELFRYR